MLCLPEVGLSYTEPSSLAKNMTLWIDTLILIKQGITSNMLLNRYRLWNFSLCNIFPFNEFFLNWYLVRKKLNSAHAQVRAFVLTLEREPLPPCSHFWNHIPQFCNIVMCIQNEDGGGGHLVVSSSPQSNSFSCIFGQHTLREDMVAECKPMSFRAKLKANHLSPSHSPAKTPGGGFVNCYDKDTALKNIM